MSEEGNDGDHGSGEIMSSFNGHNLPFENIPGGRNQD